MKRLRTVMAANLDTHIRLERIVRLIAGTMVADVCSIYMRTSDDRLELIATEGLRADSVHRTFLALNEGLVGQIAITAQPLSIQDAPRHKYFSYRPETGEDPYHAFLGVPIIKGGRVVGVLTVQNRTERRYQDDEIDTLQTIAMVLAEIVTPDVLGAEQERTAHPVNLRGRVLCAGLGMGRVRLHDPVITAAKFFAEDGAYEERRLDIALIQVHQAIDRVLSAEIGGLWGEPREVLEAYKMLASDQAWIDRLKEGIRGGLSAEASIERLRREHRARFEHVKDPYLRERLHDLENLDNRLLHALSANGAMHAHNSGQTGTNHDDPEVLVARRLGPAELLDYDQSGLKAIILEEMTASSHAGIVARGLGIPTIGDVKGILTQISHGDRVIADCEDGTVHLRPDANLLRAYETRRVLLSQRQEAFRALRKKPAQTRDGVPIGLMLNAGLGLEIDHLDTTGAVGVGLFRTEFQFLMSDRLPKVSELINLYKRVLDNAGQRPVYFRTLDLGGDKLLPNLNAMREENPALGWRSIRFALDRPGLFRRQLRALIRAANGQSLSLMFPLVTSIDEFHQAKSLLQTELAWNTNKGFAPLNRLRIGVMLETPAFAYALDDIATEVDFLSVGTNDLMQFFHAADRMTPTISERYRFVSRPAMRFLKQIRETCERLDIPVSICGEEASHPLKALCLLAIGYYNLSMPAGGIGVVKRMLRSLDLSRFVPEFETALQNRHSAFDDEIRALAKSQGIVLHDT